MINIAERARQTVRDMAVYKSARSQFKAADDFAFLDANEACYAPLEGAERYARYVDQQPVSLLTALADLYQITPEHIIAARGSDEMIDVMIRCFCEPHQDGIIISNPTFPMYVQSAIVNAVQIKDIPRNAAFDIDIEGVIAGQDENTKIVFVCSPNNPTGNVVSLADIEQLCTAYKGHALVVVDEAYIEFAEVDSAITMLPHHENLVVLRTLSKAYASAGLRCGVAIAHPDIIELLRKVLAPYPMCAPVVEAALKILEPQNLQYLNDQQQQLKARKAAFEKEAASLSAVRAVIPTYTNFSLLWVADAAHIYQQLKNHNIIVRPQTLGGDANYLRITIGAQTEMDQVLHVLAQSA